MRLQLLRGGFPEPKLQVQLDPGRTEGWSADLGYPHLRIALQYDGGTHLDVGRQSRDNARDDAFSAAGWIVIHANRDDLADGFRRVTQKLREAFRTRGVVIL